MYSDISKKTFKELTNEEVYQILDLRLKVFVMEQQIMYVDTDYKDQKCLHYMIKDNDQLVFIDPNSDPYFLSGIPADEITDRLLYSSLDVISF